MLKCRKCGKTVSDKGPYYPIGTVGVKVNHPYAGKREYKVEGLCLDCQGSLVVEINGLIGQYQKEKAAL